MLQPERRIDLRIATRVRRVAIAVIVCTLLANLVWHELTGEPYCTACSGAAAYKPVIMLVGMMVWSLILIADARAMRRCVAATTGIAAGTHCGLVTYMLVNLGTCPVCLIAGALALLVLGTVAIVTDLRNLCVAGFLLTVFVFNLVLLASH
jgi:hypothetical protein